MYGTPNDAKPSQAKQATQSKYTVNVYIGLESKLEKPTKVRPLNRRSYKKSFFFVVVVVCCSFALGYVSRIVFNSIQT